MVCRKLLIAPLLVIALGAASAQERAASGGSPPDIGGKWTGIWATYNPKEGAVPAREICKQLDCTVEFADGEWVAAFEGDCGRPYKYTIKMTGRQVGNVVLFKGTVDLGARDGGVYDWIGRATEKEFVGFYTSAHYTGVFNLSREK